MTRLSRTISSPWASRIGGPGAASRAGGSVLERYLPPLFYERLPVGEDWRGRLVLCLWALGYPLEMAWSLSMTAEGAHARDLEALISRLEDARLIAQLDATMRIRGDGSNFEFMSVGLVRMPVDSKTPD